MKTYREVDPAFGTWDDVTALARDYRLMADYMINHISAQSEYYQDFLTWHDNSPWKDLFIRYKDFWQGGAPTQAEVDAIYKRKPRAPSVTAHFADGTEEEVWCTFDEEQIDINCASDTARRFLRDNLSLLCEKGLRMIRLDAFAYATKKAGTSCFFIEPQVWELLDQVDAILKPYGATILPEIHERYTMQLKLAERGYPVYDFALPMLLLNALYYGQSQYLRHWLEICPHSQYTTLDTHDGIGVVDVKDLLPAEEIERTKDDIFRYGANVKRIYNTAAYNNLDIYQVNCTYYLFRLGRRRRGLSDGAGCAVLCPRRSAGVLCRHAGWQERPGAAGADQGGLKYQPALLHPRRGGRRGTASGGAEAAGDDALPQCASGF